jgi:hypothetical protein
VSRRLLAGESGRSEAGCRGEGIQPAAAGDGLGPRDGPELVWASVPRIALRLESSVAEPEGWPGEERWGRNCSFQRKRVVASSRCSALMQQGGMRASESAAWICLNWILKRKVKSERMTRRSCGRKAQEVGAVEKGRRASALSRDTEAVVPEGHERSSEKRFGFGREEIARDAIRLDQPVLEDLEETLRASLAWGERA